MTKLLIDPPKKQPFLKCVITNPQSDKILLKFLRVKNCTCPLSALYGIFFFEISLRKNLPSFITPSFLKMKFSISKGP